ncbi:alpha/beta hydrolase [Nocardia panacis]|uniref:Alpha/beta hydrolase n=1 Tax=Nocardia panacis TaxID=2340916 RepID=A0A3A4KG39_9NOCA|nr:alpha/beta hydrolase [Nocardia panacis]RJO73409.1 alpha/beta hydrolase [Nocardia panacis]
MRVSLHAAVECTRSNLAVDFRPEASRITLSTLVVHGTHDAFAPLRTCGQRSADLIPDSTLVVYDNASRMLHLSHRDRLNGDLLAFHAAGCSARFGPEIHSLDRVDERCRQ